MYFLHQLKGILSCAINASSTPSSAGDILLEPESSDGSGSTELAARIYRSLVPCCQVALCFSSAKLTSWSFLLPLCYTPLYFNQHSCMTRNRWGSLAKHDPWINKLQGEKQILTGFLHLLTKAIHPVCLTAPEGLVWCLPALFQPEQTFDLANVYTSFWQLP